MTSLKHLAVVAVIAFVAVALSVSPARAQGGGPNPSGGTSADPTVFVGSGPTFAPSDGETLTGAGLRGWSVSMYFQISRQIAMVRTHILQGRTQLAWFQRRLWDR